MTLSHGRHHAVIWTNAGTLASWPLGRQYSLILIEIDIFSRKCIWKRRLQNCDHFFSASMCSDNVVVLKSCVRSWCAQLHHINTHRNRTSMVINFTRSLRIQTVRVAWFLVKNRVLPSWNYGSRHIAWPIGAGKILNLQTQPTEGAGFSSSIYLRTCPLGEAYCIEYSNQFIQKIFDRSVPTRRNKWLIHGPKCRKYDQLHSLKHPWRSSWENKPDSTGIYGIKCNPKRSEDRNILTSCVIADALVSIQYIIGVFICYLKQWNGTTFSNKQQNARKKITLCDGVQYFRVTFLYVSLNITKYEIYDLIRYIKRKDTVTQTPLGFHHTLLVLFGLYDR